MRRDVGFDDPVFAVTATLLANEQGDASPIGSACSSTVSACAEAGDRAAASQRAALAQNVYSSDPG